MRKTLTAVTLVAIAAVILTGGLVASNMGFKLNRAFTAQAVGVSFAGQNTLGLPYNRQIGIDGAQDLFGDIGTGVVQLQQYQIDDGSFDLYPGVNFNLGTDLGYFVTVLNDLNYIVVGSHDPSHTVSFIGQAVGVSFAGQNFFAPPYHAVATDASELFGEIGTGVVQLQQYQIDDGSFDLYPGVNFGLAPGEAYFVTVLNDLNYQPAHY